MYLKEYLERFCILPTHLARKMGFAPNQIFRIIRDGYVPSLTIAIKISDFTDGKVTPHDIYNQCLEIKKHKEKMIERRKQRKEESQSRAQQLNNVEVQNIF